MCLELVENVADLMYYQINYRLKGTKCLINGNPLAIILMMHKKPGRITLVLDDPDKGNLNFFNVQKIGSPTCKSFNKFKKLQ